MKKIDVNRTVRVILSEEGARIIDEENRLWAEKCPTIEAFKVTKIYKKGDEYETQLWALMNMFGPSMFAGNICPFEDCEIFIKDDLIEEAEQCIK